MKKLGAIVLTMFCLLCACSNTVAKIEEQLQGNWLCEFVDGIGTLYEFDEGDFKAFIYINGDLSLGNTGSYEVTEESITITFHGLNGEDKENPNAQKLVLPIEFDGSQLKVWFNKADGEQFIKQ